MDPASILAASRADRLFSNCQETNQSVRNGRAELHVCCGQTAFTLRCGHTTERTYSLAVPVKTTRPNESPDKPFQNRNAWVTPITPEAVPLLQVLSACDDIEGVDDITISATGPAECPPGSVNRLTVSGGPAASERDIPFTAWQLFVPSGLAANTWQTLTASLLKNLHPLRLPELPAREYRVAVPGCAAGVRGAGRVAFIHAFPDVRWQGDYTIPITPGSGALRHDLTVQGELSVTWNGNRTATTAWNVLKPLLPWHGMADELSRMTSAIYDLCSEESLMGYDSSRLQRLGALTWNPAPAVTVRLHSRLFEQRDNGLLGHEVHLAVSSAIGAGGEHNLLPLLATTSACRPHLSPLRAAIPGERLDDLCVRYGVYLVAEGEARLRAALDGRRPVEPWTVEATAPGDLTLHLEGRSDCEFETVFVEASGAEDPALAPALFFVCEAPPVAGPEMPPEALKFRAAAFLSGIRLHGVRTAMAGVLTAVPPPPPDANGQVPDSSRLILPPRAWPAGARSEAAPEIPWV